MKKIILVVSLVLMLSFTFVSASAEENTMMNRMIISLDSNKIEFNDVTGKPFLDENYRTQVPFRETLEKFGATVDYNYEKRIAVAKKGDITVEVPIDTNYILKNGEQSSVYCFRRYV